MNHTKLQRGRKAVDGATAVTERVNLSLTLSHKTMLDVIAPEGISPWLRKIIEAQYKQHLKGTAK